MSVYSFKAKKINGEEVELKSYEGKALLIVNTASKCGFTSQYDELEEIYETYKDQGLEVLGFPCNQFGSQESGSNEEIQEFCTARFGIKFPMFEKIEVNGEEAHPLYKFLKSQAPGFLGSEKVKWNFTKFLVAPDGKTVSRFASATAPKKLIKDIEKVLPNN